MNPRTTKGRYLAEQWRTSNPGYRATPPRRVVINGIACVEIDAGTLWDAAQMAKAGEKRR